MKKQPLVSVYITNHNYGKYIQEAITSVLNQTMQDFEIIIIDDGSTDNSRAIIESYANDERIKVIFQQNKGLNVTNNIAMRTASGKYIMRLDADDYLDHNALLVLSNALENDVELGLVFPDYYLVDEEGHILHVEKRHEFDKDVSLLDQPAHGACTMIRKDYLMKVNGYDERYQCQDGYELWLKFTQTYKVSNVHTPLFYYRQHGSNLTSNEKKILHTRANIKKDFLESNGKKSLNTIAIIPVRDYKNSKNNLAFETLGQKAIIDWKIEEVLNAKKINSIVVTSPDELIEEHVLSKYENNDKVIFIKREKRLARLNQDLMGTIDHVIEQETFRKNTPDAIMILGIEFPFISSTSMDEAIDTMEIFDTDALISLRPETNLFFQHHGDGMKAILNQEKFSKLEREALYRYTGGISLSRVDFFRKSGKFIGGQIGHIIVDQKSAHGIFTLYDLEIARFLATQAAP
ncbi:glycosyltransferase family 2 protein [Fulvivirgaceae bacterium BMA10]|uniref:Glycosyltransferase family 2 protein n=1 Tax=Splendidivirga corallicola TaxID=3051826 RepID=A0ABT8KI93_9BACT|nr:glycosyltransferase family 2 protein [Fulvivirgaceae bacterium BMA10]